MWGGAQGGAATSAVGRRGAGLQDRGGPQKPGPSSGFGTGGPAEKVGIGGQDPVSLGALGEVLRRAAQGGPNSEQPTRGDGAGSTHHRPKGPKADTAALEERTVVGHVPWGLVPLLFITWYVFRDIFNSRW